ncbi:MAG: thiamine-phosphate kinase [Hyphomicrobium sp.]|nr:MAG: thiamine-phosphate kinase [Hyphomicrobium sp.]PPC99056.1 MAG: thiamine-phosphate kinase [Hyphomicrobium sp.]
MSDRISNETELIQTYLAPLARGCAGALDLSDDAAYISPIPGMDIVISTDPILAGVHFFADDNANDIAWKALAVNVSDLAAKGAMPVAYTMTLAFPDAPERAWMERFASGLAAAQQAFGCHLIGGDTDRTSGPLAIGITAIGQVPTGKMVRRRGARAGDHVFVTGTLGDAALGLKLRSSGSIFGAKVTDEAKSWLIDRYLRPQPRLQISAVLQRYATAAMDISDGFLKDLRRLCGPQGIALTFSDLPLSTSARQIIMADIEQRACVLAGGDDYEILFSVMAADKAAMMAAASLLGVCIKEVGVLRNESEILVRDDEGNVIEVSQSGYDHFNSL